MRRTVGQIDGPTDQLTETDTHIVASIREAHVVKI